MTKPELEQLHQTLMRETYASTYDHRPFMPQRVKELFPHMLEDCQLQYSRFKLAVAKVLQPQAILEIGVGWGVSANAFVAGCPSTKFIGIESGEMGIHPSEVLLRLQQNWVHKSTDDIPSFLEYCNPIALCHVDGNHSISGKSRDVVKAIEARPEWLLIDDVHNVQVAAGVFDGLWKASRADLQMIYMSDSWTGNLLIHTGRAEPEYRNYTN